MCTAKVALRSPLYLEAGALPVVVVPNRLVALAAAKRLCKFSRQNSGFHPLSQQPRFSQPLLLERI